MKKVRCFLMWLLFVLTVLYPAGTLIADCFGNSFELISIFAYAMVIAILSFCTVILFIVSKDEPENKVIGVLSAVIVPLSLINAVFYIFEHPKIPVIASVFLSVGCCCFITVKFGKPWALKIVALALSALMILPIGFFSFIALIFGNIGQNTIVQTVESPNGKFYAQVVDSDQGALGGDTIVDVYERGGINAIIFEIKKKPQRVYLGDWGEASDMQIYWKDDACLVINSVEYEIE